MKKTNINIKAIFSKIKTFFVRINSFKKSGNTTFTPVKNYIIKNKLLFGGIVAVAVAFLGGYYIKSLFIVATVNGSPISRMKIIKELEKRGGASILESMVTEKLIKQEAARRRISVTNEEIDSAIANIEVSLKSQSQDLKSALALQGMTLNDLKNQITLQKLVEKLLTDKVTVTDEEITKYITDNKISLPEGTDQENSRSTIKQQITQEKLGQEIQALLDTLKKAAKINIFVKY